MTTREARDSKEKATSVLAREFVQKAGAGGHGISVAIAPVPLIQGISESKPVFCLG